MIDNELNQDASETEVIIAIIIHWTVASIGLAYFFISRNSLDSLESYFIMILGIRSIVRLIKNHGIEFIYYVKQKYK